MALRWKFWLTGVSAAAAAVSAWVEWRTWQASHDFLPTGRTDAGGDGADETVLVLGCPLPVLQRWRVRIAIRSTDAQRARFVFSGAAVRTPISEARMMADYAVQVLGLPAANVVIEDQSRTTVENVVNSAHLLTDGAIVKIASNTFHARRARQIIHDESPGVAARLARAADYRPFEWGPLHAILLALEIYRRRPPVTRATTTTERRARR